MGSGANADAGSRARAWIHGRHAAICDVVEPWAHGTVVRATAHPSYYDFNLVRVEEEPAMGIEALVAVADDALAGLAHRRLDFEVVEGADRLRSGFRSAGWKTMRWVLMRHESPAPPGSDVAVEEVAYDSVHDLRVAWHYEETPDEDPGDYFAHAREIDLRREAQVLAVRLDGAPAAYAQLERAGGAGEITEVYVRAEHRGRGLGTALTCAAIVAAGPVADLWIGADDEDRPKDLYARLGFRPALTGMEFTRVG